MANYKCADGGKNGRNKFFPEPRFNTKLGPSGMGITKTDVCLVCGHTLYIFTHATWECLAVIGF